MFGSGVIIFIFLAIIQVSLFMENFEKLDECLSNFVKNKTFSKSEIQNILLTFLRIYYPLVFLCIIFMICLIIYII